jgi:regulator of ribonuclease activity A
VTSTSDLYDEHRGRAIVCELQLRQFGGVRAFSGEIATVRCSEDNVLVKRRVAEPGNGRVLVVDGGGSLRCALAGDSIAGTALASGWAGLVINGCVRDVDALGRLEIGIKALGTCPRPSGKEGHGALDVPVVFGAATFTPGARLWSDEDGIIVLDRA